MRTERDHPNENREGPPQREQRGTTPRDQTEKEERRLTQLMRGGGLTELMLCARPSFSQRGRASP